MARSNDLYLFCCGASHKVAPMGRYVAFMSTTVEGSAEGMSAKATAERELAAGLQLLTGAKRIFFDVYDLMSPAKDGTEDKVGRCPGHERTTGGAALLWLSWHAARPGVPVRVVRRHHPLRDGDQRRAGHVQAQ